MVKKIYFLMTVALFASCYTKFNDLTMTKIPYYENELDKYPKYVDD